MASKRQLEGQDSCETADADDSSKRPRLPDPSGEGTSGLNISNQQPEDAEDDLPPGPYFLSEEEGENNSSSEEDVDSAREDACDRISTFPALVQDQVFGFLGVGDKVRMAQVCSSWSEAVFRPCHWSHLKVNLSEYFLSKEHLKTVNERGICQVIVKECNSKEKMKMVFQNLPSLSSLELKDSANANILFEAVGHVEVSGLKSLCIETSVDEQVLLALPQLFRSFPNLEKFSFTGRVGSDLLEVMDRKLPRLKELTLSSSVPSSELNMRGLENFSGLECLRLSCFSLETFETLIQLKGTLRMLGLTWCDLPENEWATVLSQMSSLEDLDLSDCFQDNEGKELKSVCGNVVNLKRFLFSFSSERIDDSHLKCVAKLSSLQELCLSGFGVVTIEGIGALGNLPHLKVLHLEFCAEFTPGAMELVSQISSLQELRVIEVFQTSVLLEALSRGSCKLKRLEMHDFKDVKGEGMAHIAQMSSLRKLYLAYGDVGPAGMELLSQGAFTLEVLKFWSCDVTVEGLMPLFERQTCLREVSILDTGMEDDYGIDFMRTILPNLEQWKVGRLEDDELL